MGRAVEVAFKVEDQATVNLPLSGDDYVLDDLGRLLLRVRLTGEAIQRSHVWSNGTWRIAVKPFETRIEARIVSNTDPVRAMGNHLFANLATGAGQFRRGMEWTDAG